MASAMGQIQTCTLVMRWEGTPMSRRSMVRRVWLPTLLTAATSTVIAIVVILATTWKTNPWAWIAVGVLTVLAFLGSLWLQQREQIDAEPAKGIKVGKDVRIDAKHGSAAAWRMGDVSFGANPSPSTRSQLEPLQSDVEVEGYVGIYADQGSAAAWSIDSVSMGRPPNVDPREPGH